MHDSSIVITGNNSAMDAALHKRIYILTYGRISMRRTQLESYVRMQWTEVQFVCGRWITWGSAQGGTQGHRHRTRPGQMVFFSLFFLSPKTMNKLQETRDQAPGTGNKGHTTHSACDIGLPIDNYESNRKGLAAAVLWLFGWEVQRSLCVRGRKCYRFGSIWSRWALLFGDLICWVFSRFCSIPMLGFVRVHWAAYLWLAWWMAAGSMRESHAHI